MKIILIGFMGAGKSSVAKILAQQLNLKLYELDQSIIEKSGLKSGPEIFEKHGEEYFRKLESEVALEIGVLDNCVISPGGGIILKPENMQALKAGTSKTFHLSASFEILAQRVKDDSGRFLFRDLDQAKKLFLERSKLYQGYADYLIETEEKTPDQVAREIILELEKII